MQVEDLVYDAYQIPQPWTPYLANRKGIITQGLEMCSMNHIELNSISSDTLSVYHKFLLQMITVEIILSSMDIPRSNRTAIPT